MIKKAGLPEYTKPPVVETVLSIQFAPTSFSVPHFGLYWEKIQESYPDFETHPPLGAITEKFGSKIPKGTPPFGLEFVTDPMPRCWFLDKSGNAIIQVQSDRFIQNWRMVKGGETYPRYDRLRAKFREEWLGFCSFLNDQKLGQPAVNQCEVTYVNHIEYGKSWKTYGELSKAIACWSGAYSGNFLPPPEGVNIQVRYLMPENQGRLHISMQPVIRARDSEEVLQLNLTARGAPSSSEVDDVFTWLDLGRAWVVQGFTDITTPMMHETWGRIS